LVATHAIRHTDHSLETHSFFSHHLGDTLLLLFVICSRHTTSSSHGDTRRLIRHTDPSRHTGNFLLLLLLGDLLDKPSRHTGCSSTCRSYRRSSLFFAMSFLSTILLLHRRAPSSSRHRRSNRRFFSHSLSSQRQILLLLWLVCRRGLRLLLTHLLTHFFTDGVAVLFFSC